MSDERRPKEEEPLAMNRADEAMYIQDAAEDVPPPEPPPSDAEATAEPVAILGIVEGLDVDESSTLGRVLRLVAASLALLTAVGLFYPAINHFVSQEEGIDLPDAPPPELGDVVSVMMLVDSKPEGATVHVGDKEHGTTPAVFSVECQLGSVVETRLTLNGYKPVTRQVECAVGDGAGLKVKARLKRR